jgi:dolichyl-phosphate-mannose--protein O-mannosyl transferase
LVLLLALNLALRWGAIAHPRGLVFDEVYYAEFGLNYLQGQPFFDVHPPLGKYLIALSIGLFYLIFPGDMPLSALTAPDLNPISYRWLNGLIGAVVPLLAGWMAWEWGRGRRDRPWLTLLTALLTSLDGLALVESRLALLHPALVAAGFVALAAWRRAIAYPGWGWPLLAGVALGAAVGVKWNGAGYALALVIMARGAPRRSPGLGVAGVAALTYGLLWWPHLAGTGQGFWRGLWTLHRTILQSHLNLDASHPYTSPWYSWPLLLRPMAYFYETGGAGTETPTEQPWAIALYGMGNPVLWWLATAALTLMVMHLIQARRRGHWPPLLALSCVATLSLWLPWAGVSRSTFLYHYQPAALMAEVGLAALMARWLTHRRPSWRWLGGGLLGLIIASFLFWLPLWLGWPLSLEALGWRWWLPSWI